MSRGCTEPWPCVLGFIDQGCWCRPLICGDPRPPIRPLSRRSLRLLVVRTAAHGLAAVGSQMVNKLMAKATTRTTLAAIDAALRRWST